MHKIILSVICLFLLFGYGEMQAQLSLSPKVGINGSILDSEYDSDTDLPGGIDSDEAWEGRLGWNLGMDLRMRGGWFLFQPGVHYLNTSSRLIREGDGTTVEDIEEESSFQTLKVPVTAGIFLTGEEKGLVQIHLRAGIVPTLLLGVDEKSTFAYTKDDIEDLSWGILGGIGIDILIFTIDVSYEEGISNFLVGNDAKNKMFIASVGFAF